MNKTKAQNQIQERTNNIPNAAGAERGITLIALIITIIVMLILVAVTVSIALNGGLFGTAKEAVNRMQTAIEEETYWADRVISEAVTGWNKIEKPVTWTNEKVTAVSDGINVIPIPQGYSISMVEGEHTIEEGVVIKDSKGNEFVWIPVSTTFTGTYSGATNYSEPTALTATDDQSGKAYDSQDELDYWYGPNYYNYATDFAYSTHYSGMVESVNKYGGFFVARYETTVDGGDIGSKYNKEVLTRSSILKEGTNIGEDLSGEVFYYRWWGLYNANRKMNVVGNGNYIQTNMIWGQQWDAMISYFDSKSIDYSAFGTSSQGAVVKSGQSTKTDGETKDKIYNIYDLRTNGVDYTAEACDTYLRSYRGGSYNSSYSASHRRRDNPRPTYSDGSSRATLYIR